MSTSSDRSVAESRNVAFAAFALAVIFTLFGRPARAQTSDGRDFYVGLLYPNFNAQHITFFGRNVQGFFGVYLLVSSYDDNTITVGYFDDFGNEINKQTYNIQARRAVQVPLDIAHMKTDGIGESAVWKSCHVTARRNVSVQFFSTGACSGGSYLALPTPMLGKQYTVTSYHDNPGGYGNGSLSSEDGRGMFEVVAPFDSTLVTITPSTTTNKGKTGVLTGVGSDKVTRHPFTVLLHRGQLYPVFSPGTDASFDLSGTTVKADKPVAVIAGNENGFVDGGNPDPAGTGRLDARDFMVEQLLPVSLMDTTGYMSIPFAESGPASTTGSGDSYVVVASTDTLGADVIGVGGSVALMGVGPYAAHEDAFVHKPTLYYSNNGQRFGVMQYDHREQPSSTPFTSPSMMSVISSAHWKHSYLFYVPNNTFETLQTYYLNVICRKADLDGDSILVSANGVKPKPLQAVGFAVKARYDTIPGSPDLVGVTYACGQGVYYLTNTASATFIVYNYGNRGIDPDRDLGDLDGDDFFFSYAAPGGCAQTMYPAALSVSVDTMCSKWTICARDLGTGSRGIKSFQLLDDPHGDIIRPGKQYYNAEFEPALDPDRTREIQLTGNDSSYCVDVVPSNLLDTAYAPVLITTNDGGIYIVELHYTPSKLAISVEPNFPNQHDSIVYPPTAPGGMECATVHLVNTGKQGDPVVNISAADLNRNDGNFRITNVTPVLPVSLRPGDTMSVTVCFTPQDQYLDLQNFQLHLDSLRFVTPCYKIPVTLYGPVGVPLLYATDKNFGNVVVGTTKCDTITIRNVGNMPLTLTDSVIDATVLGNHDFAWDASNPLNKNRLPVILKPGQFIRVGFCFSPTVQGFDSASTHWLTDVQGAYRDSIKSWSVLHGNGVKPGVVWDRLVQIDSADSTATPPADTFLVNLLNVNTARTHVIDVFFDGPDANEFSILSNQYAYNPLKGFDMDTGSKMWVQCIWLPDLTKGFHNRSAHLVATYTVPPGRTDSTVIEVTGTFHPRLSNSTGSELQAFGATEAYLSGRRLYLRMPPTGTEIAQIELYDVLGRRVFAWSGSTEPDADGALIVPMPQLASGVYVVRATSGNSVRSVKVVKQ